MMTLRVRAKEITQDGAAVAGIQLLGRYGRAAHLTLQQARDLADRLHDMADALDPATAEREKLRVPLVERVNKQIRQGLTDANGDPEPPLPDTPAD